jgi:hypothetical protein
MNVIYLSNYKYVEDIAPSVINTALELTGDLLHVACSMAGVA